MKAFLGFGLPWLIVTLANSAAAFTPAKTDGTFLSKGSFGLDATSLKFSVPFFCGCALLCTMTLCVGRYAYKAELGHRRKLGVAYWFVLLWLAFVVLTAMQIAEVF